MRLSDLIHSASCTHGSRIALAGEGRSLSYVELSESVTGFSNALHAAGVTAGERVAVFAPKSIAAVVSIFGSVDAGAVAVPVNPVLKPAQVAHILTDSGARVLVTCRERYARLSATLDACEQLESVIIVDTPPPPRPASRAGVLPWPDPSGKAAARPSAVGPDDIAALLYTSGSTGRAKGVVLTHSNLVLAARSVSAFLGHQPEDRLLCVLPLSFDAGLSQLSSAFASGASAFLFDYLFARDLPRAVTEHRITGVVAVPPVWIPVSRQPWSEGARVHLRYVASTGGAMPRPTIDALRAALPGTDVVVMYGFTEAFRATYLDPGDLDTHPGSVGKAIPHAEVLVVRPDGSLCDAGEPGELVQRGPLVARGYWNDPERTARRFRPISEDRRDAVPTVWSGDIVKRDADGHHYFVERRDEMIKTSGYRVSPTEVESVLQGTGLIDEVVAFGVPHEILGQVVGIVFTSRNPDVGPDTVIGACREQLPGYMVPQRALRSARLPRNANGKLDRQAARRLLGEAHARAVPRIEPAAGHIDDRG